ncbi:hypothetical protein NFI96_001373, partial [Prochilodus magdalenae]
MSSPEEKKYETRSECSRSSKTSKSSKHSVRSAASLAALGARARAEAARARALHAQREIDVKVKKAQLKVEETRLDATLEAIQQEKEADAAFAEANVFELAVDSAAMGELSGFHDVDQGSSYHSGERTERYVQEQYAYVKSNKRTEDPEQDKKADFTSSAAVNSNFNDDSQTHHEPPSQNERQRLSAKATMPTATTAYSKRPPVQFTPKRESEFIASHPASEPKNRWTPRHDTADDSYPQGGESTTYASVLGRFLARRELLTAGLTKFNDKPEHYWAWRSAFSNATEDLGLKPSEELDLLIKWLGPESAEHARRVRSVRINYPGEALSMVWQRLEEVYGSPEAMETALFNKLERFPKFSNKEPKQLRELGDLLLEIQAAKEDGFLPALAYLDTARGINPILEKLPFNLQEKWMVHGTKYKEEHHTNFPPFSVFADFIRAEARMRNDPSFAAAAPSNMPPKWEKYSTKSAKTPIAVHKTEVDNPAKGDETKGSDNLKKECPIHKKPHPLTKCRAFRAKLLDERKAFLKKNGICFRCCSSTAHQARDCRAIIQCSECNSDKHIAALHAGPAPWSTKPAGGPSDEHGGEGEESTPASVATSICTEVCGDSTATKSCAKICLVYVYPKNQPEKKTRVYAILDDQSNRSLARSSFFEMFNIADNTSPYTLKTCAGVSEAVGRRARGFIVESADEKTSLALPTLIECDQIPDNRAEIPTPAAVKYHPHLKSLTSKIPPLDPEAEILLLLGRDIIQVHKVLEQRNGPPHAPFAQRLALGWVIVGDVCINGAHVPSPVNTYRTYVLENGRPSVLCPCLNKIEIKEKLDPSCQFQNPSVSEQPSLPRDKTRLMGESIFCHTKDDDKTAPSMEDLAFLRIMEKELKQGDDNSWQAPLPFRSPRQRLPNNLEQARTRLAIVTKTLRKHPERREHFTEFMSKLFENGHAEVAPPLPPGEECWYLPLFGVYHPQKPGQVRVVFDSSAQHQGVSLNDVLLTGPNMNNSLLGVLMRFRREPVAVTTDIQQMFHCFVVREDHRNFLRFLWHRNNDLDDDVIEYRMRVHVFGNSPSPSVATYGLRRAAAEGEKEYGIEARLFVERNFYVDDGLLSVPSEEEAITLLHNTQDMLALSNLRLHKILSNRVAVMRAFPPEDLAKGMKDLDLGTDPPPMQRSLGVSWDISEDVFTFQVADAEKPYTRRGVLSTVNSLFDPLGFAAPVSIHGRSILRELTTESCDWDAPLPEERYREWKLWRDSLKELEQLKIPRQYTSISLRQACSKELCVFCDASTTAIAAVAYVRTTDASSNVEVGFMFGKAKLAPRPETTVPRLELCAAVLAVEIADMIVDEMDTIFDAVTFYSDSKVVLGYIHNESRRFYVYVSNRVQRIRRSTSPQQWKYVPSGQNPADHGSRSVPAGSLIHTSWLCGPPFLLTSTEVEPAPSSFDLVDPSSDSDVRPQITCHLNRVTSDKLDPTRFEKFSSWRSLNRAVARLVHVAHSFTQGNTCQGWHIHEGPCPTEDLEEARNIIIRAVQQDAFTETLECIRGGIAIPKQSPLLSLCPYLDTAGILRIGGRLSKANLDGKEVSPVILPGQSHVTTLLIRHYHEQVQHQGRHLTEGAVRAAGLWIISGKRRISSILHCCVTCRRLRRKMETQKMADLPAERLSADPPFSFVGVDVFGPWMVTARRTRGGLASSKRWAALFTCMSTRAIHIEVLESMDSSSFINALRRFFSVRGPAKQMRSDCGTNFVGACKELQMDSVTSDKEVQGYLSDNGCRWIFNPPHSSHMGGSWERLIGLARRILDSMLLKVGPVKLTHEVLTTFMAEVSAILNARPLVPVSTDPDSPFILTPATLLTQKVSALPPPKGEFDEKDLYGKQWRQVQSLANTFWHRWRTEYLPTLQRRRKWEKEKRNLKEGDVIILKNDQLQRNDWPMGVIVKTFPSADGR